MDRGPRVFSLAVTSIWCDCSSSLSRLVGAGLYCRSTGERGKKQGNSTSIVSRLQRQPHILGCEHGQTPQQRSLTTPILDALLPPLPFSPLPLRSGQIQQTFRLFMDPSEAISRHVEVEAVIGVLTPGKELVTRSASFPPPWHTSAGIPHERAS